MKNITTLTPPTAQQTPIEVALKIDESGMTTAKALYEFLELHPAKYAKWCKDNISNNSMAEKGKDFEVFNPQVENSPNGGRPSKNYKITATFAKKLAMGSNSKKGEQAKNYFILVEDTLKSQVQQQAPSQLPQANSMTELQALKLLIEKAIETENRFVEHEAAIQGLQDDVEYIRNNIHNNVIQIVEETPVIERTNEQIILAGLKRVEDVYFTTTDIRVAFGMKSTVFVNKFFCIHGIIMPHPFTGGWTIAERYESLNLCSSRTLTNNGNHVTYICWNERGVKFLINFLRAKGFKQIQPVRRDPTWRRNRNKN